MKYLIKIDPKSVRKNPNDFRTQTNYPSQRQTKLSFTVPSNSVSVKDGKISAKMPYQEFILDKNLWIEQIECSGNECECICVAIGGEIEAMSANGKVFEGVLLEISQDYETINHMPEPEYFFKYQKQMVTCDSCSKIFLYTELNMDEDQQGNCIENICPKCGAPDCCILGYEKFDKTKHVK